MKPLIISSQNCTFLSVGILAVLSLAALGLVLANSSAGAQCVDYAAVSPDVVGSGYAFP